jgi:hypothetical protein
VRRRFGRLLALADPKARPTEGDRSRQFSRRRASFPERCFLGELTVSSITFWRAWAWISAVSSVMNVATPDARSASIRVKQARLGLLDERLGLIGGRCRGQSPRGDDGGKDQDGGENGETVTAHKGSSRPIRHEDGRV